MIVLKEKLRKARQSLSLVARLILAAAIVTLIIWKYKALVNIDVRALIASASSVSAAVGTILGVYFIKAIVLVVPASMIYVALGLAFPMWQALLINAAGIIIELCVTWCIGRLLGGDNVTKILGKSKKGQKLLNIENSTKYSAFFGIRFLPFLPIDFVSLFMGTTTMKFLPYLLISFCGIMPRVVLFTVLGDKIYDLIPMKYTITAVLIIIVIIIAVSVVKYAIKVARGDNWEYEPVTSSRRNVILDTDIGPDSDDAGALAVLLSLMKREDMAPLGIVNCTSNKNSNGVIRAILNYFGFYSVPVAQTERDGFLETSSDFAEIVNKKYMSDAGGFDVEHSLGFYKKALKDAQDDSAVIVSIGMLNNIAELTAEYPDLVRKKVHALVAMAGKFPEGAEFNIVQDVEAAKYVFENFPRPIICSGYEVGEKIITGFDGDENSNEGNPVYDCYLFHNTGDKKAGRVSNRSWDLTAVQFAFEGCGDFYKMSHRVKISIDDSGANTVENDRSSDRYYLKLKAKPEAVGSYLNTLMSKGAQSQPVNTEE